MEKKNTMLLTVIAVATLLVAVVGATFAYFSLQTGGATTTTATVSSGEAGVITFEKGVQTLTLKVTAADMAQPVSDTYYFAVEGAGTPDETTGGIWAKGTGSTAPATGIHNIASVKMKGGATTDTYTCSDNKVSITATGDMIDALKSHAGWAVLKIYGSMLGKATVSEAYTIDLSSVEKGSEDTDTVTVPDITFEGQGGQSESSANEIKAELYLLNSATDANQSAIAGTSVDVTIKFTPGTCTVKSASTD